MTPLQLLKNRIVVIRAIPMMLFVLFLFSTTIWEMIHTNLMEVCLFLGIVFVGMVSLRRMWCALYIADKKCRILLQNDTYSNTRNSLYFFSIFGLIALGLFTESFLVPLLVALGFFLYFPSVINMEEADAKELYGKEFEDHMAKVPRFFQKSDY